MFPVVVSSSYSIQFVIAGRGALLLAACRRLRGVPSSRPAWLFPFGSVVLLTVLGLVLELCSPCWSWSSRLARLLGRGGSRFRGPGG